MCLAVSFPLHRGQTKKHPDPSQSQRFPANQGPASAEDGQAPVVFFHHFGVLNLDGVPI